MWLSVCVSSKVVIKSYLLTYVLIAGRWRRDVRHARQQSLWEGRSKCLRGLGTVARRCGPTNALKVLIRFHRCQLKWQINVRELNPIIWSWGQFSFYNSIPIPIKTIPLRPRYQIPSQFDFNSDEGNFIQYDNTGSAPCDRHNSHNYVDLCICQ